MRSGDGTKSPRPRKTSHAGGQQLREREGIAICTAGSGVGLPSGAAHARAGSLLPRRRRRRDQADPTMQHSSLFSADLSSGGSRRVRQAGKPCPSRG
eukprot:365988-Chlamydomonas_euryale.AAC.6